MDTLTQLTLGAACGEAVLGKKIGNRAMLWGAFGGALPDFDIAAYFLTDEMSALAFHRGFMHSILFAFLAALGLGWLVEKLYASGFYKRRGWKAAVAALTLLAFGALGFGINSLAAGGGKPNLTMLAAALTLGGWLAWAFWKNYLATDLQEVPATRREWVWLFWWSIFTHPVLDCFTAYGTQIFQPFSDYRVAFNNISVVDFGYTLPFLLCLLAALFFKRESKHTRRVLLWLGIGLSSAYMVWTLWNKHRMDGIFERSLEAKGIAASRCQTSPVILQNFLWQGIAEGDTAFYHGHYSFFDKSPLVDKISVVPKNHELLAQYEGDRTLRILRWFSNGYYNVIRREDGKLQLNDLRYGNRTEGFGKETDYVFRFVLEEKNGRLDARQTREGDDVSGEAFRKLFERVRGN